MDCCCFGLLTIQNTINAQLFSWELCLRLSGEGNVVDKLSEVFLLCRVQAEVSV